MRIPPNGSVDAAALAEGEGDFGGMVRQRPAVVVRATNIEDVTAAIRHARAIGCTVVARGQGHTTRGQSQAADGVSIQMRGLRRVALDAAGRTVRVGAGLTWGELLPQVLAAGLVPPTLTDYLGLSIGGTLSVGGIGGQSFRYGAQSDQVERLVVVTGTGQVISCSATQDADLFDACRAGLGQCAVIVEAVLRLMPAPTMALVGELAYADLRTLMADQERLIDDGRFDYLLGSIVPTRGVDGWTGWRYRLEAVKYGATDLAADASGLSDGLAAKHSDFSLVPFAAHAARLEAMVAEMKRDGSWTALHPWMDLFLPAASAFDVIAAALESFSPGELADGHLMTYPLSGRAVTTPLLGVPRRGHGFLFDVLPNIRDTATQARFEAQCRTLLGRARRVGGAVYPIGYPVGTPDMGPSDWRRQLGEARWTALASARDRYNPDGRLAPNVAM